MNVIRISINCDGAYCGKCHLQESENPPEHRIGQHEKSSPLLYEENANHCRLFDKNLSASGEKTLRCKECLSADIGSKALFFFKHKYNIKRRENSDGPCCGNCKRFISTGETINLVNFGKPEEKDVQLGICQLAEEEKCQITKTIAIDVCDAHIVREGTNGGNG